MPCEKLSGSGRVNQPNERCTISDAELGVDVVKVKLHRSLAQAQPTGYFLVG